MSVSHVSSMCWAVLARALAVLIVAVGLGASTSVAPARAASSSSDLGPQAFAGPSGPQSPIAPRLYVRGGAPFVPLVPVWSPETAATNAPAAPDNRRVYVVEGFRTPSVRGFLAPDSRDYEDYPQSEFRLPLVSDAMRSFRVRVIVRGSERWVRASDVRLRMTTCRAFLTAESVDVGARVQRGLGAACAPGGRP